MAINASSVEALLYEDESTTLDFKRDQYQFDEASDKQKSELLKDILAFANAWKRSDAYILIGVEEVKGGKSTVVGLSKHLEDASIQQFVNSKTQRPVSFSYIALELEGKQIGVLHIPIQTRPLYLNRDYGHLKKNIVYIRRGSSTEEASPDEIAKMGEALASDDDLPPLLDLQFGNEKQRSLLGTSVVIQTVKLNIPSEDEIPDYGAVRGVGISFINPGSNKDYYRECAVYCKERFFLGNIGFAVTNSGTKLATDVWFEIEVPDADKKFLFCDEADIPSEPSKNIFNAIPSLNKMKLDFEMKAEFTGDRWFVTGSIGKIQPKQTKWTSRSLLVGSNQNSDILLPVRVFADNLQEPKQLNMDLHIEVIEKDLDVNQLISEIGK